MKKKFFALCLSIAMFGTFCSCVLADDDNKTEKDSETKVEETVEKNSEIAASESELQLEKVYDSMCNSIIQEYCEPNNIAPKDFVWPEKSSIAWMYFGDLAAHHTMELMGLNTEFVSDYTPSDSEKSLMEITFNSILEWIDTNPEENTAYYGSILQELNPYHENIPEKITIADFEIESGCETETTDTKNEEVNEYGLTESQLKDLYGIIKENISKDYLESSNLSPQEFTLPENENFWSSFNQLIIAYENVLMLEELNLSNAGEQEKEMFSQVKELDVSELNLDDNELQIISILYESVKEWSEKYELTAHTFTFREFPWKDFLYGNIIIVR